MAVDATPLLGTRTGIGVFCAGALRAVSARPGLAVQAFAVSWRRRGGIDASLPPGVDAHQRPMPARPLQAAWRRSTVPPLEWFIGPVDVVHGTNFVVPPARRAVGVASVHDLTPLHHPELCNPATLAFPDLIRRAVTRGAWVHADSAFVAAEVCEAFAVDPARVRVVHPGIPPLPDAVPREAAALATRWPVLAGQRLVLAVGTSEPRKDLPGLVASFDAVAARHDDLVLVLAGPPGWDEAALDAAVARSPFPARVLRTGWVDDATLGALFRSAHVLAYPSRYEGFGFPPLQAMSLGVPVVATRVGSLPEVLGDGAMLVTVGDRDALSAALEAALDDEATRRALIAGGMARAATFTWESCGAGLESLYRDAAAGHRG